MTKMSDVAVPSLLFTEGTEPSAPAAGKQRLYIDSTSHKLKRTDSAGADVTIESAAGFAFTWTSGTSMPGSPATGDRVTRTDFTPPMDFFYDGTRWRSMQVRTIELKHEDSGNTWPPTASTAPMHRAGAPQKETYDLWLLSWHVASGVLTTNNGTNFWTGNLYKFNSAGGGATVIATFATSGDTADTYYNKTVAINAALGSYVEFYTEGVKTLSPGAFRMLGGVLTYQIIGT